METEKFDFQCSIKRLEEEYKNKIEELEIKNKTLMNKIKVHEKEAVNLVTENMLLKIESNKPNAVSVILL
jgi:hypothetical protein